MDNKKIIPINKKVFDHTAPTDVISCTYAPIPGEDKFYTGELFVNVQRAVEEGTRRAGWTTSSELALYIAHGCDHLSGEDDHDNRGRIRMRRRDLRWVKTLHPATLLDKLIYV